MRTLSLIALFAATLAVTGCSGAASARGANDTPSPSAAATSQAITVTARDTMRFEPSTITVRAGEPIQLTLVNAGKMPHDFTLREGVARRVKVEAGPGKSASGTFTIDRPGTYTFICDVSGHEAAGMKGTITAQ
jgi:uncharacterized cupredoxin-like copper-binding protein